MDWLDEIEARAEHCGETREFDIVEEITVAWEDRDALLAEVERLRTENDGYKADIEAGRMVKLPCREFFEGAGDTVWLVWGGEAIEMVHCGATIDAEGKPFAILVCEDKIFPYRTPVAERDLDPTDWCTNTQYVSVDEYNRTVFMTEDAACAALGKEREDG